MPVACFAAPGWDQVAASESVRSAQLSSALPAARPPSHTGGGAGAGAWRLRGGGKEKAARGGGLRSLPAAGERSPVVLASLDTGIFPLQSCRKSSTPLSIRSENRGMAGSCRSLALLVVGLEVQVHKESPIFPLSLPPCFPPLLACLAPSLPVCPPALLRQNLEVYPGLVRTPAFSVLTRAAVDLGSLPRHLALGVRNSSSFLVSAFIPSWSQEATGVKSPATSQH